MVNRRSLDFWLNMLDVSILHVSFPFFLIPVLNLSGFENESTPFLIAAVYGSLLLAVKIAFAFHDRSQRKDGKVDWEDEIVLITGGTYDARKGKDRHWACN